jgi:transcriptional regulator with XRE-family HTH domain
MPDDNASTNRDADISARLKQIREGTGLTRVAFCRRIGLDSSTFSHYEHGRAAVPWDVARRVCVEFDHSIHWLACGTGNESPCEPVPASIDRVVDGRMPLAKAWDLVLRPVFSADSRGLIRFSIDFDDAESKQLGLPPSSAIFKVTSSVDTNVELLPLESIDGYCDVVLRALDCGFKGFRAKVAAGMERQKKHRQVLLDTASKGADDAGVKQRSEILVSLSSRIEWLASKVGGQAALARKLNVSRQSVSLWIKGITAPDAEHLLLLQRVEERFQK